MTLTVYAPGLTVDIIDNDAGVTYVSDSFAGAAFRAATGQGRSDSNKWWVEQRAGANRATYSGEAAVDGGQCLSLATQAGDYVLGVDSANKVARCDVATYVQPLHKVPAYGEKWWFCNSLWLPADFYHPVGPEWTTVMCFHGDGNDQHGLTIEQGQIRWKSRYTGTGYSLVKNIAPDAGLMWHHFKGSCVWKDDTTGEIEVWYRTGADTSWRKVVDARAGGADATIRTALNHTTSKKFLKIQNYHPDTGNFLRTTRVCHDRVRVATNHSAVDFYR
jgi:hypothetical protein